MSHAVSVWARHVALLSLSVACMIALCGAVLNAQAPEEGNAETISRLKAAGAFSVETEAAGSVVSVYLGQKATDENLVLLADLKQLRELSLETSAVTEAGLKNLRGLDRLESLSLYGTPTADSGLAHVAGLRNLRILLLDHTRISDAGLAHLAGLRDLAELSLGYTEVGDDGLASLGALAKLRELRLRRTAITDGGLRHIAGLTQLRRLDLSETQVMGVGLRLLGRLPDLDALDLTRCPGITSADLGLLSHFSSLRRLYIRWSETITDDGYGQIAKSSGLVELGLGGKHLTGKGIRHLNSLRKLEALTLSCPGGTFDELSHLKALAELRRLDLFLGTDTGLVYLQNFPSLEHLAIAGMKVTPSGVEALKRLTHLKSLDLASHNTTLPAGAEAELREALPDTRVETWKGF